MVDSKQRILIVEDDVDLAEMLSAYFGVQGYIVDMAHWGEDAIRSVKENIPELILLDIRLPDFDGFEVCRRLREMHRTRHIPVIFLTEKREREDKLAGLELGAVDYITKPFDIKELHLRMRNSLRRARLTNLRNPVTGLAEGKMVEEQLELMLKQDNWGLVYTGINNLHKFRNKFGFVAADDVVRAISLMLKNALKESNTEDSFMGHVNDSSFVLITTNNQSKDLAESCEKRLQAAIPYFYPATATLGTNSTPEKDQIGVNILAFSSGSGIDTYDDLRKALNTQ